MAKRGSDAIKVSLAAAIVQGVFDNPPWAEFLRQLREHAGAKWAILHFRPPGRKLEDAISVVSEVEHGTTTQQFDRTQLFQTGSQSRQLLEDGRAYSLSELQEAQSGTGDTDYAGFVESYGLPAVRQMRVREPGGVDAWLTILRPGADFGVAETALLEAAAPILRGALQIHVAMDRERFAAALNAEAVRRMHFGWMVLDSTGLVLECDAQAELMLAGSGVIRRYHKGRLGTTTAATEREIYRALAHVNDRRNCRPRAIALSRDPWLDMLMVPARGRSAVAGGEPVAIAFVHGDNWQAADRHEQLAELFALSPHEAKLALALSRGLTLAEAAEEFGLTVGSARTYSKNIYAKTGARGLPDLVRIVMRSVLAIAPDL